VNIKMVRFNLSITGAIVGVLIYGVIMGSATIGNVVLCSIYVTVFLVTARFWSKQ